MSSPVGASGAGEADASAAASAPGTAPGDGLRRRRVRYRGTHPRRFAEKYKEHAPEKYGALVEKVLEAGKTPAGMHRPICVAEVLDVLRPVAGEVMVDATLGYGGHARALLGRLVPGGRLIGLDTDPIELPKTVARLRAAGYGEAEFQAHQTNYAGLARLLGRLGLSGVDAVLADLGCSSMQLDDPARGFSFKHEGPLDLRMNPAKGRPGWAWLEAVEVGELERVLRENADEPHATALAQGLRSGGAGPVPRTTRALATRIEAVLGRVGVKRAEEVEPAVRRVFQALRIEVNEEFAALETFLRFLPGCLNAGGRVAVLTFHSGEDRRVKRAFEAGLAGGDYRAIAREVVRPGAAEVRSNPRASSAKLRWAVRASAV